MNNLSIGSIISMGFKNGLQNMASLIGAIFLWLITIWIPYLNVGTTIAIIDLVPALSRGESISPTGIFNKKYRDKMGDFFLATAFIYMGTFIGYIFLLIPGLVIGVAWTLALYLLIDKDMKPMEAINTSYDLTYGKKWTIFLGVFLLAIILGIIMYILMMVGELISLYGKIAFTILGYLIILPVSIGAYAHIYSALTADMGGSQESPSTSVEGF